MAIPAGTKFLAVPSTTDTTQRKSDQNNDLAKVYTIEEIIAEAGGGSSYTETIVNISSAQILDMGSSPIELLPAPGVGKYNKVNEYVIEADITSPFTLGTIKTIAIVSTSGYKYIFGSADFLTETGKFVFNLSDSHVWNVYSTSDTPSNRIDYGYSPINDALSITFLDDSNNSVDPTDGDGTMRIIIYSKERTFGA